MDCNAVPDPDTNRQLIAPNAFVPVDVVPFCAAQFARNYQKMQRQAKCRTSDRRSSIYGDLLHSSVNVSDANGVGISLRTNGNNESRATVAGFLSHTPSTIPSVNTFAMSPPI